MALFLAPKKILTKGNGGSQRTPVFLLTHSLARACDDVVPEMLHERLGIVLKSAMDGKGKRRDTTVRSVVAAKLQAVLKSREVCIDLVIELVSKLRFIVVSLDIGTEKMKLIIEREARPPSRTTQRTRRMRKRSRWSSL